MSLNEKQAQFVREYLIDLNATQAAIRAGLELRAFNAPATYYVYLIAHPVTGRVVYVGKGKGRRALQHGLHESRNAHYNGRLSLALRTMLSEGVAPAILVVDEGLAERTAYHVERSIIDAWRDSLTNIVAGTTLAPSPEDRAKHLLSKAIPFDEWMATRQRSAREQQLYRYVVAGLTDIAGGGFAGGKVVCGSR